MVTRPSHFAAFKIREAPGPVPVPFLSFYLRGSLSILTEKKGFFLEQNPKRHWSSFRVLFLEKISRAIFLRGRGGCREHSEGRRLEKAKFFPLLLFWELGFFLEINVRLKGHLFRP